MASKYLIKHKWLSLKKTSQDFIYAERDGVNSTATLCFRKQHDHYEFLIRYQPLQDLIINGKKHTNWKELFPCPVTGSLHNETWQKNVIEEVYEEAGYKITTKNFIDHIQTVSSTQMNEIVHVCLVQLKPDQKQYPIYGDGSHLERVATAEWRSETELRQILFKNKEIFLSTLGIAYLLFIKHVNNY